MDREAMRSTTYLRLETDAELIRRASSVASHQVTRSCCDGFDALETVDRTAERHGVRRRIVEVSA